MTLASARIPGAGLGYGGSCFPKDVKALDYMAGKNGRSSRVLKAVMEVNSERRVMLVEKTKQALGDLQGKVIGLMGLTFKPNTDDLRDAPALDIARMLLKEGAQLKGYDPVGMPGTKAEIPEIQMAENAYDLVQGCDAVIVCTEWNEFKHLDLQRLVPTMRQPIIIDGRNIYDPVLDGGARVPVSRSRTWLSPGWRRIEQPRWLNTLLKD